jgi:hypothetical protein
MTSDHDDLEEIAEKLKNAVRALASLARSPQERLDRALAYFVRTFREAPEGPAHDLYRRIYVAIGDPPPGTTISIRTEVLAPEELDDLVQALVDLEHLFARACGRAELAITSPQPAAG